MEIQKPLKFVGFSSLNVTPPPEYWSQFVEIKKNHMNPKISRPPFPHVTLINPFVNHGDIDVAYQRMADLVKDIEPFELSFEKFEIFKNQSSSTLFLAPVNSGALENLYSVLAMEFDQEISSFGKKSTFSPHIGVGYFKGNNHFAEAKKYQQKYQRDWKPIKFLCKEIYIMTHITQETPYEVRKVIPLGKEYSQAHFKEISYK